jgi:hypothetical protein
MKRLLLLLSLVLTVATASAQDIIKGDANNDKKVNRLDVLEVSDAIMGKPSNKYNAKNADANSDDKVNAADIVVIVNMVKNDSENPILVVWKADGTKAYYELNDMPETTFEDGKLVIRTQSATVEYPMSEVLRYTYDGVGTNGVSKARGLHGAMVKRELNSVTIVNLKEDSQVQLFNSEGTLLDTKTSNGEEPVVISVANQPNGVYMVKYESQTIKLIKQ